MDVTNILLKPVLTEKSYLNQMGELKKYVFAINPKATKTKVKLAFEIIYGVKPLKINTLIRKPVTIRNGTKYPGFSKLAKLAVITLPKGMDIAITGEKTTKKETKNQ